MCQDTGAPGGVQLFFWNAEPLCENFHLCLEQRKCNIAVDWLIVVTTFSKFYSEQHLSDPLVVYLRPLRVRVRNEPTTFQICVAFWILANSQCHTGTNKCRM